MLTFLKELDSTASVLLALQALLLLGGAILIFTAFQQGALARWLLQEKKLSRWELPLGETLQTCWLIIVGSFLGALVGMQLTQLVPETTDKRAWVQTMSGAFLALGSMSGMALAFFLLKRKGLTVSQPAPAAEKSDLLLGAATFVAALPIVVATALLSRKVLEMFGWSAPLQELVEIFRQTESTSALLLLTLLAVVVAPFTEELFFRAGIFRILRRYTPRWTAILVSSVVFALLHQNAAGFVSLTFLGAIFAWIYERTGRISVPIIAHAFFNLNTVLMTLLAPDL